MADSAPPKTRLSQPRDRVLPPETSWVISFLMDWLQSMLASIIRSTTSTVALLKYGLLLEMDGSFPINSTIKPSSSFFCCSLSIGHSHQVQDLFVGEAFREQHQQVVVLSMLGRKKKTGSVGAGGIDFAFFIRRFPNCRIFRNTEGAEGAAQLLLQIFW